MKSINYPVYQRGRIYHFHHRTNTRNFTGNFNYHYHPFFEIYLFVDGETKFVIEDVTYNLSKNDIMIVPPYKFHCPIPSPNIPFERIVLNIFPSFFSEMACENYIGILNDISRSTPRITSSDAEKFNLLPVLLSIDKHYDDDYTNKNLITTSKITELIYNLYLMAQTVKSESKTTDSEPDESICTEIMKYISKNFATVTDVSSVTEVFHYSKNYLNGIFQKNTGITIAKYIKIKRFENVEKLYKSGLSLESAAIQSGFGNYRHYAYAYKKEYGVSPRNGLGN